MALHLSGTALPLVLLPEMTWKVFPVATLEGQYILKNVVLVAGAMVLGGAMLGERGTGDAAQSLREQRARRRRICAAHA